MIGQSCCVAVVAVCKDNDAARRPTTEYPPTREDYGKRSRLICKGNSKNYLTKIQLPFKG
jgi:hypothetical protein